MKKITKELYEYEDIIKPENENLLNIIIEKEWDINIYYNWYEFILEDYNEGLKKDGFSNIEFEFTGFLNQGDGASFVVIVEDKEKLFKALKIKCFHTKEFIFDYIDIYIKRSLSCHYSHKNSCFCEVEMFFY